LRLFVFTLPERQQYISTFSINYPKNIPGCQVLGLRSVNDLGKAVTEVLSQASAEDYVLFLEDTNIFCKDFRERLEAILKSFSDFDVLFLASKPSDKAKCTKIAEGVVKWSCLDAVYSGILFKTINLPAIIATLKSAYCSSDSVVEVLSSLNRSLKAYSAFPSLIGVHSGDSLYSGIVVDSTFNNSITYIDEDGNEIVNNETELLPTEEKIDAPLQLKPNEFLLPIYKLPKVGPFYLECSVATVDSNFDAKFTELKVQGQDLEITYKQVFVYNKDREEIGPQHDMDFHIQNSQLFYGNEKMPLRFSDGTEALNNFITVTKFSGPNILR